MNILVLSYVNSGYGTPQINFLIKKFIDFYGEKNIKIWVYEPIFKYLNFALNLNSKKNNIIYYREYSKKNKFYEIAYKWIDLLKPNILLITHFKYFNSILKSKFRPNYTIYYLFESPDIDTLPSNEDLRNHYLTREHINMIIFPEYNRYYYLASYLGFKDKIKILIYNASLLRAIKNNGFNNRNKKIIISGNLDFKINLIEKIFLRKDNFIIIDLYGIRKKTKAFKYLHDLNSFKNLVYKMSLNNQELNKIRKNYLYSFVAWKPLSKNYLYACPNKFYESIAAGIPPIFAPHPQCIEIHKNFNIGIPINGWNQKNIELALNVAENILGTKKYKKLVENCLNAYKKELNWDYQFIKLIKYLPEKTCFKTKSILNKKNIKILLKNKKLLVVNFFLNKSFYNFKKIIYNLIINKVYKKNYKICLMSNNKYYYNNKHIMNIIDYMQLFKLKSRKDHKEIINKIFQFFNLMNNCITKEDVILIIINDICFLKFVLNIFLKDKRYAFPSVKIFFKISSLFLFRGMV